MYSNKHILISSNNSQKISNIYVRCAKKFLITCDESSLAFVIWWNDQVTSAFRNANTALLMFLTELFDVASKIWLPMKRKYPLIEISCVYSNNILVFTFNVSDIISSVFKSNDIEEFLLEDSKPPTNRFFIDKLEIGYK